MTALELDHVSIRYKLGDFRDIGLKEYVMRKLKGNYEVIEFWADKDVTFTLEKVICLASSAQTEPASLRF